MCILFACWSVLQICQEILNEYHRFHLFVTNSVWSNIENDWNGTNSKYIYIFFNFKWKSIWIKKFRCLFMWKLFTYWLLISEMKAIERSIFTNIKIRKILICESSNRRKVSVCIVSSIVDREYLKKIWISSIKIFKNSHSVWLLL